METFERTVQIDASPAEVFRVLTDLKHAHRIMPDVVNIERLDDQPFGLGTKWKETRKIRLFGFIPIKASATIEVTEFAPGKAYTTVAADDCNWAAYTFTLTKEKRGTRLDLLGQFKCLGKWEGNEKKAKQMARFCEKADGDLLDRVKLQLES